MVTLYIIPMCIIQKEKYSDSFERCAAYDDAFAINIAPVYYRFFVRGIQLVEALRFCYDLLPVRNLCSFLLL